MALLTRAQVAEALGVCPTTVYRWERVKRISPVTPQKLKRSGQLRYTEEDLETLRQWYNELEDLHSPLDAPDLPLFKGENPDVRQEAREIMGDWWLEQPNIHLAGEAPIKVIEARHGARVRNIIRSVKYIGIS